MALQGTYIHYTFEDHPTELEDITITYPSDLSEDHPDYDKRGTSEVVSIPVQVEVSTTYENCYIMVGSASLYALVMQPTKVMELGYLWRIYESEEARNTNPETYIEIYDNASFNFGLDENPFSLAYSYIASRRGAENLTTV
jgi:hypothetical protein